MSYFDDLFFTSIKKLQVYGYRPSVMENENYSIEYIKKGSIILVTNQKRQRLTAPVVFWMLPGNSYQLLTADDKPVEHFWADFYGSRADRMLESIKKRIPKGMITITRTIEFEAVFEAMIKVFNESPVNKQYEAVVGLERLIGIIFSSTFNVRHSHKDFKHDFITILAEKINLFPLKEYDFREKAKQNGLSYHHFRKLFKNYNHMSPHDYLIRCRMEYAVKIIQQKNIPIKELAAICGFNETSSFSRMFKRKMGISPEAYAKASRNKQINRKSR